MKEVPNMAYIHQLSGGDLKFEEKLLEVIRKELPKEKELFEKFIEEDNLTGAASLVHKIKHKIAILSMESSYRFAEEYEEQLRIGENKSQEKFIEILQRMFNFIKIT